MLQSEQTCVTLILYFKQRFHILEFPKDATLSTPRTNSQHVCVADPKGN